MHLQERANNYFNDYMKAHPTLVGSKAKRFLNTAERTDFDVGGNNIVTYKWGASGEPVLLLHGAYSNAYAMRGFIKPLLEKGYQVVALEAPGHGASDGNEADPVQTTEAIVKLNALHGQFKALISHSFGCITSLYAIEQECVAERAVTISCPSSSRYIMEVFFRLRGVEEEVQPLFYDLVAKRYGDNHFREFSPMISGKHLGKQLTLIHDQDDDIICCEESRRIHTDIPESNLHLTTGLGHFNILNAAEVAHVAVESIHC